jgi:hypothetical protein
MRRPPVVGASFFLQRIAENKTQLPITQAIVVANHSFRVSHYETPSCGRSCVPLTEIKTQLPITL